MTTPRLEYAGFRSHRHGRIHLFCPQCGLKRSNVQRTEYDPPRAVLAHLPCESCSSGCKVEGPSAWNVLGLERLQGGLRMTDSETYRRALQVLAGIEPGMGVHRPCCSSGATYAREVLEAVGAIPTPDPQATRVALRCLLAEVRGMLGIIRPEMVAAASLTNVRCLERSAAHAALVLGDRGGAPTLHIRDMDPAEAAALLAEDDAAIEAAYAAGAERDASDDPREYEAESDPKKYHQGEE